MTKFTKGPWEVYAELNVRSVSGDAVAACGPQRGLSDDGGNAENKANAALIAAAPELYAFAKKISLFLENMHMQEVQDTCDQSVLLKAEVESLLSKASSP